MLYWNNDMLAVCTHLCRQKEERLQNDMLDAARDAQPLPDPRTLNPLQMAYLGDTLHDLYVRTRLVARGMRVGDMHKQAVRMVSAEAQAKMLTAIEPELTEQEADVVRRGRNAQAKHAAPHHASATDYAHATALEALWGYLYITGQNARLDALVRAALSRTEDVWQK